MADSIFKQMGSVVRNAIDSSKISLSTKTSDFDAVNNNRYLVDTTNNAIVSLLPQTPIPNEYIEFIDLKTTFELNNLILNGNGKNINGSSDNFNLDGSNSITTLIYSGDSSIGWIATGSAMKQTTTPELSGNSSGVISSKVNITISNYNASFIYTVVISGGSYTISGDTITWTLPAVSSNSQHLCDVKAMESGKSISNSAIHYVNVEAVEADDAIIVDNYDWFFIGEELNNTIETDKVVSIGEGSYLTKPFLQEEHEYDFAKQTISTLIKPTECPVLEGSTVSSLIIDGYVRSTFEGFYGKYSDNSLILTEYIDNIIHNFSSELSVGIEHIFNNATTSYISTTLISENKICISYRDSNNYGTSIIGTISGDTIVWGKEYIFNATTTSYISSVLISENKICVSYQDSTNSSYGTSIIGTITGDSIVWGSEYVFNAGSTSYISTTLISENKICVSYQDTSNSYYGTSIIGTISGNTIVWGSEYVFNAATTTYISSTLISENKICVSYRNAAGYGSSIIGIISGNTIAWGSEYVFNAASAIYISSTLISENKICVSYRNAVGYGISIVGIISGNTIVWGSEYIFNTAATNYISSTLIDENKIYVSYQDNTGYGTTTILTVDLNSILILNTPLSDIPNKIYNKNIPTLYSAIGVENEYINNKDIILSNINNASTTGLTATSNIYNLWTFNGYHNRVGLVVGGNNVITDILSVIENDLNELGSKCIFNAAATTYISSTLISENKICVACQDGNSNYGTSIIGTIIGNSIVWGSSKYIFNYGVSNYISSTLISENKICVSYQDNGNSSYGTSIIGTISGDTISWGSEYVFNAGTTVYISSTLIDENRICVSYSDGTNSSYGTSIIGTISGNTIVWGSEYVFNTAATNYISSTLISENKICVSYQDNGNSAYGTSIIGTISGNTIVWGSEYIFNTGSTAHISSTLIDKNKICVSYQETYGTSIIGTISGNTIVWGSEYVFNSDSTLYISTTVIDKNKICVSYRDSNTYGTNIIGTISGNTIVWGSKYVFNDAATTYISSTLISENKICVSYRNADGYGTSIIQSFNSSYSITYEPQNSIPTKVWKPAIIKQQFDLPIVSATTSSIITDLLSPGYKVGIDTLDLIIDGVNINDLVINSVNNNFGDSIVDVGIDQVFNVATTAYTSIILISENKVCVSYQDIGTSYYGTSIVGTISGNTISWGSKQLFNAAGTYSISSSLISENKICVSYQDTANSSYGTSIIGTISGNTISWGSEYVFNAGTTTYISSSLISENKICVSYQDNSTSSYGTSIIGTISGNTISWGSEYVFNTAATYYISSTLISENKVCVSYQDGGNSYYGTGIIGTISGNIISWGSEYVFNTANTNYTSTALIAENKICVSYTDVGNSSYGTSIIGTISGNTIVWGSESVFNRAATNYTSTTVLGEDKICISYQDAGYSNYGMSIIGTISGDTIVFGNEYMFNAGITAYISLTLIDENKICVSYQDGSSSSFGISTILTIESTKELTFDTQAAVPTKATLSGNNLVPNSISYHSLSDTLKLDYDEEDFSEINDIRQLKYMMTFNEENQEWVRLYVDLSKGLQ